MDGRPTQRGGGGGRVDRGGGEREQHLGSGEQSEGGGSHGRVHVGEHAPETGTRAIRLSDERLLSPRPRLAGGDEGDRRSNQRALISVPTTLTRDKRRRTVPPRRRGRRACENERDYTTLRYATSAEETRYVYHISREHPASPRPHLSDDSPRLRRFARFRSFRSSFRLFSLRSFRFSLLALFAALSAAFRSSPRRWIASAGSSAT